MSEFVVPLCVGGLLFAGMVFALGMTIDAKLDEIINAIREQKDEG